MNSCVVINRKFFKFENLSDDDKAVLSQHFSIEDNDDLDLLKRKSSKYLKKNFLNNKNVENIFLDADVSIKQYITDLSQEPFLNRFRTICLFVHEKGLNTCIRYDFSNNTFKTFDQEITTFNKLFQSIKKSKNKSFGQSTLKGISFEIIGTFLAKNFSFNKHNAIFIVSRDDFLPQSEEDIQKFNSITDDLHYSLGHILREVSLKEDFKLIKSLINNLPITFEILKDSDQLCNSLPGEQLLLKNHFGAKISKLESQKFDHVDLFHRERIGLLGELLNTLRHEISNPLFGLKLTTELLGMEELNESQIEFKDEILLSLKRCSDIIEDFTDLYKSDKELKKVSLAHLVNEVLTLTKSETREIMKNTIFPDEDEILITTNPTWLVQILFNLIINATHALKEAGSLSPKIDIEINSNQKSVSISVTDNGPNIPENKLESIFQPFYTTKKVGTGLGLSISRNLAKKMGGNLEYAKGCKGASFKLTIPND